ncbi:MAG: hypothetical protein Q9222_000007 [Ikaeria aurantiellina]
MEAYHGDFVSPIQIGHKGKLYYTTSTRKGTPDFGMVKPIGEVHEIVIAIEDDGTAASYPIPPPPPKTNTSPFQHPVAPSFRLQAPTPPPGERPTTPASLAISCPSPTSSSSPPSRAASPTSIASSPCSRTTSPTLVRNGSTASTGTYSPVMRSMFPRYDPTVSLAQQRYQPAIEISPALAAASSKTDSSGSYSPSLYSHQEPTTSSSISQTKDTGFSRSGLTNALGLQGTGKLSEESDQITGTSDPELFIDLWALANGQKSSQAAHEYRLELSCEDLDTGKEIICFDSSTSQSFYTLSASENALSISRSHPTNNTTTIQISTPTLQTPSTSSPVVAPIFPKLAELMAIDKSSSVAINHKLDRQTCTDLQTEAVERAYNQEASSLLWDSDSQKYYLIHPTLLDDDSPAAFPIEVSSTAAGTPREITILSPNSTIPVIELSFETLCLNIHVDAITAYSSLYLLDTLISATLILLLHLHRSRSSSPSLRPASPTPSTLPFFAPPPTIPSPLHPKSKSKKERRLTSWSKSFFSRPQSQPTTTKPKTLQDGDEESAIETIQKSVDTDSSLTAKLPHPPSSKFHIIDPADERLPRTTRAVLRILYWGFECLIWGLGVLVNMLAMMVLGVGKLVKIL